MRKFSCEIYSILAEHISWRQKLAMIIHLYCVIVSLFKYGSVGNSTADQWSIGLKSAWTWAGNTPKPKRDRPKRRLSGGARLLKLWETRTQTARDLPTTAEALLNRLPVLSSVALPPCRQFHVVKVSLLTAEAPTKPNSLHSRLFNRSHSLPNPV